jgi:hypothetical protein
MTDKQVFRMLTRKLANGEISTVDAQLTGERLGIDFADFQKPPTVCARCGTTKHQWFYVGSVETLCGTCSNYSRNV